MKSRKYRHKNFYAREIDEKKNRPDELEMVKNSNHAQFYENKKKDKAKKGKIIVGTFS